MIVLHKGDFLGTVTKSIHINGVTATVTEYSEGDTLADSKHYHDHSQLYFIIQGGSIEKLNRQQTERQVGSLLFYHAGEWHQNIRKGVLPKSLNIEIEKDFLEQYDVRETHFEVAAQISLDMRLALVQIYKELLINDSNVSTSIQMTLLSATGCATTFDSMTNWPQWIKRVREILHDRWNQNVTLAELSFETGINPVTISKYFPRFFSCTLGSYMRKLKIEKSLALVKGTQLSLTEIAFFCGFADQSHFIRTFRDLTGFLPAQFRKN